MYNTAAITPDDVAEYLRVNERPGAIECGAAYYSAPPIEAEGGGPIPPDSLTMPLHYVAAEFSFGGHLGGDDKAAFSTIRRYAADATYDVLDRCSHWVSEDRPATLARKIGEFFAAWQTPASAA